MSLNIKTVKVYLISPCVDKYKDRLFTVFSRLLTYGFQDIVFFKSVSGTNGTNSLTNTVIEIMKLEMDNDKPFMILEDDCEIFTKHEEIEIPDNCDALYLGASYWVYPYSVETVYSAVRPHIFHNSLQPHQSYNDMLTRIGGMTGGHAIMFISREFMKTFLDHITTIIKSIDNMPHDLLFGCLQFHFNVYALKQPLFYQDSALGGQEDITKITFNGQCYC